MPAKDDFASIDRVIGRNIRTQRLLRQVTQKDLSDRIGVSFQQLQKYERGANRISASRLHRISLALGVPLDDFFGGAHASAPALGTLSLSPEGGVDRLTSAYSRITDMRLRRLLIATMEHIASS